MRSGQGDISAVTVSDDVERFARCEGMSRNHLSQLLSRSNAMSVFVTTGTPGKELSAISLAVSSKRLVRITEQGVVRPPTTVALPVRTWNKNCQEAIMVTAVDSLLIASSPDAMVAIQFVA